MADYSRTRQSMDDILTFTSSRLAVASPTLKVKKMGNVDLKDVFHYLDSVVNAPMVVIVCSSGKNTQQGNILYKLDLIAVAQKMTDISTAISNLNTVVDYTMEALDYQIYNGVIFKYEQEQAVDIDKWSMVEASIVTYSALDTGVSS